MFNEWASRACRCELAGRVGAAFPEQSRLGTADIGDGHLSHNDWVAFDTQGGIDLLVDLLVSLDSFTAEAARYCLLSLRRGNTKNQAEIIASIRTNTNVIRNIRCVASCIRCFCA